MSIEGTEHLRKIIGRWDSDFDENADSLENCAAFLFQLDQLVADVRMLRSRVEQTVAKRADTKIVEFPGGTAEIKAGAKRTQWDNDLLYSHVVARALDERQVNEATGEYESEGAAVARVLGECARPSWRLTPLRARGIQPDDFCHVEWGAPSVIVRAKEHDDKGE